MTNNLFEYLKIKDKQITEYIEKDAILKYVKPNDMHKGVLSYLLRSAKRLRPSVLLMACGSLGGVAKELQAVPAAVGVELFHTWTLVHDDIIDNDQLRRGGPTVHKLIENQTDLRLDNDRAKEYGTDVAILAGDIQHGWSTSAFIDCALTMNIDPHVILQIIKHLETYVLGNLIYGETLDVQFGFTDDHNKLFSISEEQVIEMLWLKTGVLYEFAGMAGAMIGKNTADINDPDVQAVKKFTGNCGIAFQLQDDILGILGDEKVLGKPIGSDIREGKKTTIVLEALKNANQAQRSDILATLGNKDCKAEDIKRITNLFVELNGIEHTKRLALNYINEAIPYLNRLEDSYYKGLLYEWAEYMVNRNF